MTIRHGSALDVLRGADRHLARAVGCPGSLAPGRARATPLVEIGEALLHDDTSSADGEAFARALGRMVQTQVESFPGNLFWDTDFAAARLLAAVRAEGAPVAFDDAIELLISLQIAFGRTSRIQFRYVHDFSYGFDWARWVRGDPARSGVGPFGVPFLWHMRRRAAEIEELILQNDARYPRLEPGSSRNPFGFGREPGDEERLHRDLAERGLIPVEAWRLDAAPRWELPFSELREERARELGLWRGEPAIAR